MSDARDALPNSSNYIQNSTAAQAGSNFNIGVLECSGPIGLMQTAEIYPLNERAIFAVIGSHVSFTALSYTMRKVLNAPLCSIVFS